MHGSQSIAVASEKHKYCHMISVGCEVLTAGAMKRTFLWDIISCGSADVHSSFGVISCLHLQRIKYAKQRARSKQQEERPMSGKHDYE